MTMIINSVKRSNESERSTTRSIRRLDPTEFPKGTKKCSTHIQKDELYVYSTPKGPLTINILPSDAVLSEEFIIYANNSSN